MRRLSNFGSFTSKLGKNSLRGSLLRPTDLPSVADFVDSHIGSMGKDLKGVFSSDPQTNDIAKQVFDTKLPETKASSAKTSQFFSDNIFHQPNLLSQSVGSVEVLISDINDFPAYKQQYEKQENQNAMICIGGPAAEDQVVLAGVIEQVREKLDDIIYMTRDYKESNVNHSAKQSHARHGNALNADSSLSGHRLLPVLLMRKLIGVDLKDVLEPDYKKIDVKFTIDPTKLRIYFGNELNWLKQELKKFKGELTEHDINRLESSLSQEILKSLEKQTGVKVSGGMARAVQDSSSIHINFSKQDEEHLKSESEDLAKVGIASRKLSPEKHEFFFGQNEHIHSAYEYLGDNHILFNAHQINQELAEANGAKWLDGEEVTRIMVKKNEQGNAEVVGVVNSEGQYSYCNKLHFTGGYKVKYAFDPQSKTRLHSPSRFRNMVNKVEDFLGLQTPLTSPITTATGVSINAIFKKSDHIKSIIEKYGSTGEIAVTNSHWTMIAQNDDYLVMRMTGGGNTGSEEYKPEYFLNVLANTRKIFGDDLIGILSTYGCPRAVNAKDSTEFDMIAEGAIVSYGKGGTGNTKRHSEAAFGLMMLGFKQEVVEHFNKFQTKDGKPLGDDLLECYEKADEAEFFHNNIDITNRRMGYDSSFSAQEMLAIGGVMLALSIALYQGIDKEQPTSQSR